MQITIFATVYATTADAYDTTWPELVARCLNPPLYQSKQTCPLIKLATFGDKRTGRGSLRHDANVRSVSGLEGDYDGEEISPEVAKMLLESAGIAAVIYTSPSHTPSKPRWRVLAPLSADAPPDARRELVFNCIS